MDQESKQRLFAPLGPQAATADWKTVPIVENGEPLVPLGPFSAHRRIFSDAIYFGEGESSPYKLNELKGALLTPFLRRTAAEKLAAASERLPAGMGFMIWDSYRPLSVQQGLYDDYHRQLVEKKGLSAEAAMAEAQRFVSIPSTDPTRPPPHNSGGAVDLTIVSFAPAAWKEMRKLAKTINNADARDDWHTVNAAEARRLQLLHGAKPLDMGGAFDEVSEATLTRYFEKKLEAGETLSQADEAHLNNRRLLVNIMAQAGFSNYEEEWWHFDFGNQFDAKRRGANAVYGPAAFTAENAAFENMRCERYFGDSTLQHARAIYPAARLGRFAPPAAFAKAVALRKRNAYPSFMPLAKRLEVAASAES